MSKFRFGYFMAMWAIAEGEKRKQEERYHQRQESKRNLQKIHKQNVSKSLGQHRYRYLFNRSR